MSNALAIAAITAVLRSRLENALVDHVAGDLLGEPVFSALAPDRVEASNPSKNQLNLFLYRVKSNPGWNNLELPARRSEGARVANVTLALDLYYLMSAYGATDLGAEMLLGYGMQVFHETPVLARDSIQAALAGLPARLDGLRHAGLADQLEQIKIVPHYLDADEMSRIWSATQAHYRPSTGYQVSAALIESDFSVERALPVRTYNVYGTPLNVPIVWSVVAAGLGAPLVEGATLVITGQRLRDTRTWVVIDGARFDPADEHVGAERIEFPVPAGLRAGLHALQVACRGTAPRPESGFESNTVAFLLQPQVQRDEHGVDLIGVTLGALHGELREAVVTIVVAPDVAQRQRVQLQLNELGAPPGRRARAYTFSAEPWADPNVAATDTIRFPVQVERGEYLVRVQVDGAASPLAREGDAYARPKVRIE